MGRRRTRDGYEEVRVMGYGVFLMGHRLVEEEGEGVVLGFGEHAGEGGEDGDGDLDDHAPCFWREFLFHKAGC